MYFVGVYYRSECIQPPGLRDEVYGSPGRCRAYRLRMHAGDKWLICRDREEMAFAFNFKVQTETDTCRVRYRILDTKPITNKGYSYVCQLCVYQIQS